MYKTIISFFYSSRITEHSKARHLVLYLKYNKKQSKQEFDTMDDHYNWKYEQNISNYNKMEQFYSK